MELIFIDGKFYPRENARVSIFDHGFLFGDGLFETIRAYNGVCFRLTEHLERLYLGAEVLRIIVPYSHKELVGFVAEAVHKNRLAEAYIRVTLTRGVGKPGIDPRTCPKASVIIAALPLTHYPAEAYAQGWEAVILNVRRNSSEALPPEFKSMSFLNNILAKLELIDRGKPEGFFLNRQGYLTEGVVSNLFVVSGERIFTPDKDSGILPGITRKIVLELCEKLKIPAEEKKMVPEELYQADECFVTNSLAEILPIRQIDNRLIGTGRPGPLTRHLHKHYQELVKKETG
jgi:branched-chain amino acid aminotransferase